MTLKRYPIRAIKSIVFLFIFALLIFGITYLLGEKQIQSGSTEPVTFWQFMQASDLKKLAIFFTVFGLIYPFIGYIAHKVPSSRPLTETDKEKIKKLFDDVRYQFVKDENEKLFFRTKNPVARVTRMFEDTIEVDYSGNPIIVEGQRRDTYRMARAIDWLLRKSADETQEA